MRSAVIWIEEGLKKSFFFMRKGFNSRKSKLFIALLSASLVGAACSSNTPESGLAPVTGDSVPGGRLVVYSGRSEPLIQPVLDAFRQQHPQVEVVLRSGSNSEMANALLEEQNNPQADVFITTEIFTIQSLTNAGLFHSYRPVGADGLPEQAVGPQNQWVGLTRRARVIMYNTDLVPAGEAPQSVFDLTHPQWKGQIAAAGSTNGSMQAQIAAMRELLGEQATEEWLRGLVENDVTFFGGHTDVRKAVGSGEFKLGLVNHYYYHLQLNEGSPVGVVYPDQGEGEIGLITNFTAAAILNGSRNLPAAQALIDFLVSPQGQQLFAELNFEYPMAEGASLHPDVTQLSNYRLAEVDVAGAAQNLDQTFDLIEAVGMP